MHLDIIILYVKHTGRTRNVSDLCNASNSSEIGDCTGRFQWKPTITEHRPPQHCTDRASVTIPRGRRNLHLCAPLNRPHSHPTLSPSCPIIPRKPSNFLNTQRYARLFMPRFVPAIKPVPVLVRGNQLDPTLTLSEGEEEEEGRSRWKLPLDVPRGC